MVASMILTVWQHLAGSLTTPTIIVVIILILLFMAHKQAMHKPSVHIQLMWRNNAWATSCAVTSDLPIASIARVFKPISVSSLVF